MRFAIALAAFSIMIAIVIAFQPADATPKPDTIEIACYSGSHLIFIGKVEEVNYVEGIYTFTEMETNKVIFTTATCIVKI